MNQNFTKFAFTPSVVEAQEHYGSRANYARMENDPDRFLLTDKERDYIPTLDAFFMATTGENGWPYVQFRGGPRGFLKIIDDRTLGFADYRGNRQYVSVGNINSGGKVALILLDFARRVRLKIWATATVTDADDDPGLAAALSDPEYKGKVERLITLTVEAYDWNCPQHITPRYTEEEIAEDISRFCPEKIESCENCG
jgi:predicted pyridoxine 5'-phosphate oxidase superfamily flavin-nucleotide-binding protein